jgi:hypothetical protein
MIDIARAMLPGGSVADYQIGRGLSEPFSAHSAFLQMSLWS